MSKLREAIRKIVKEMEDPTNFVDAVLNGDYNKKPQSFRDDLFVYHNVSGPKAKKAFSIAYNACHSNGLADVMHMFSDLVELIK